jgi:hypothetical protein
MPSIPHKEIKPTYINSVKLAREAENAWRFGTGYECEDDGRNDGV